MFFDLYKICAKFVNEPANSNGAIIGSSLEGDSANAATNGNQNDGNFVPVEQQSAEVNFELESELNELATDKNFGNPPEQNEWKSDEVGGYFGKGGNVQKGKSDKEKDIEYKAKRVGYRYTDAFAKKNGLSPNAKPPQAHIEKYLGKGVYLEERANRSDKSRSGKI